MGDKGHLTAQTKSTLLEHQLKKKEAISTPMKASVMLFHTCLFLLQAKSGLANGTSPTLQSLYFLSLAQAPISPSPDSQPCGIESVQ